MTTLEINIAGAGWVTPESLGIACGELILRSLAPDEMTLSKALDSDAETMGLAFNTEVAVRRNGVIIFRGHAQAARRSIRDGSMTETVQLLGGFWHLTRVTFLRKFSLGETFLPMSAGGFIDGTIIPAFDGMKIWLDTGFADATPGTDYTLTRDLNFSGGAHDINMGGYLSTAGDLFYRKASGTVPYTVTIRSLAAEVIAVLQTCYAGCIAFGAPSPLTFPDSDEVLAAVGDPHIYPNQMTFVDRHCGDLLVQMLQAKPTVSTWVDYSTEPPTFHIVDRADMEVKTMAVGQDELMSADLSLRTDLVPTGVYLTFASDNNPGISGVDSQDYLGHTLPLRTFQAPAGAQPNDPGTLCITIFWSESNQNPDASADYASAVWNMVKDPKFSGSMQVITELPSQWHPGQRLTFPSDPSWSAGEGLVQEVRLALDTGIAQITVGYPPHLDIRRLVDLQRWLVESYRKGGIRVN